MERSGRSVWLAPDLVLTVLTRFRGFGFGSLLLGLGNCPSGKPGNLGAFSTGWPPGLVLTSVTRFRVWSSPVLGLALGLVWVFWPGVPVELVCFSPLPWFGFAQDSYEHARKNTTLSNSPWLSTLLLTWCA